MYLMLICIHWSVLRSATLTLSPCRNFVTVDFTLREIGERGNAADLSMNQCIGPKGCNINFIFLHISLATLMCTQYLLACAINVLD